MHTHALCQLLLVYLFIIIFKKGNLNLVAIVPRFSTGLEMHIFLVVVKRMYMWT